MACLILWYVNVLNSFTVQAFNKTALLFYSSMSLCTIVITYVHRLCTPFQRANVSIANPQKIFSEAKSTQLYSIFSFIFIIVAILFNILVLKATSFIINIQFLSALDCIRSQAHTVPSVILSPSMKIKIWSAFNLVCQKVA